MSSTALAHPRSGVSRVFEHRALQYRRTFRASIFSSFLTPVLFLAAMGLGLGSYVDTSANPALGGVTYLQFLAPGLLATTCMQSAAFEAGFGAARGQVIATIDADLQNDPEEIPRLLPMLDNYDMVTGWRKDRQDTPFRRWQSRQANRIRNWISQETVQDSASSLKLYKAHAIKGMKLFNGAHRFFPTLVKMRGYTVREEPVKHSPRFAGTAKYGFGNRAFRAFVDLLGVRWMKTRNIRYQVTEVESTPDRH